MDCRGTGGHREHLLFVWTKVSQDDIEHHVCAVPQVPHTCPALSLQQMGGDGKDPQGTFGERHQEHLELTTETIEAKEV